MQELQELSLARKFALEKLGSAGGCHDFDHTLRVLANAEILLKELPELDEEPEPELLDPEPEELLPEEELELDVRKFMGLDKFGNYCNQRCGTRKDCQRHSRWLMVCQ